MVKRVLPVTPSYQEDGEFELALYFWTTVGFENLAHDFGLLDSLPPNGSSEFGLNHVHLYSKLHKKE
jgi:hypothetical protein